MDLIPELILDHGGRWRILIRAATLINLDVNVADFHSKSSPGYPHGRRNTIISELLRTTITENLLLQGEDFSFATFFVYQLLYYYTTTHGHRIRRKASIQDGAQIGLFVTAKG